LVIARPPAANYLGVFIKKSSASPGALALVKAPLFIHAQNRPEKPFDVSQSTAPKAYSVIICTPIVGYFPAFWLHQFKYLCMEQ
jgi:hypothetical protein